MTAQTGSPQAANTQAPAIELRLLGSVQALRDGRPLPLGGPRQRALLAVLVLQRGRPVSVDRLAAELWADEPTEGAAATLRTYISRLRAALQGRDLIRGTSSGYALDIPDDAVDSIRFETLARTGMDALQAGSVRLAAARLRQALSEWRGEPFDGVVLGKSLHAETERLAELHLTVIESRIDADLQQGRAAELVDELYALVDEQPFRERLWRHLMLALYRAGRQADALAAFRRARSTLDEELGLEPGPELQQLEIAILRHEVPPVVPLPLRHNIPEQLTSFVGRQAELAEISALFDESRLVTLTGVGGVGKTRLALEAARRALGELTDEVVLVDLAPLSDESLLTGKLAEAVGMADQGEVQPGALVARLRDDDALLVLDNCEHLRAASAQLIHELLRGCARLRILATSREVLGVPGEIVYSVPPMSVPSPSAELAELRDSPSVRLLLARAHTVRPALSDDPATLATAARICIALDGLPLAIELAAARARALSLDEIALLLSDRFRFLVSWRRLTPARHRTLREAMDWSYELLSEDEQELLADLSVFVGGFTLEAVADVCLGSDGEGGLALIERLIDASLVVAEEHGDESRYRLLETVRQYASDRLEERGRAPLAAAHGSYYLSLAERRIRAVHERGVLTPLSELAADDANLRAALAYFVSTDSVVEQVRMCAALWRYWWLRGQIAEGRRRIGAALDLSVGQRTTARAEALRGASHLALRQTDYASAIALAEESAALARSLVDQLALARAEAALANAASGVEEFDRAEDLYRSAATRFRAEQMTWELAIVLMNTADLALNRGDYGLTEQLATESLSLFRKFGDESAISVNLGNIALAALEQGDHERAQSLFEDALERSHGLGFGEWVAIMLSGLAAVAAAQGTYGRASRLLGAATRLRGEIGASPEGAEGRIEARTLATVRERLGSEFDAAFEEGGELSASSAVTYALSLSTTRRG